MTFTNLMVGLPTMLLCLAIQAASAFWAVRYYIRQSWDAPKAHQFFAGIRPLLVAMLAMMLADFVQITLWGALFVGLEEFSDIHEAIYHSAVNYASLGYGDIVMSKQWRLLGPLEAVNGVLMLGMTAAALMAILQQLIKTQRDALLSEKNAGHGGCV